MILSDCFVRKVWIWGLLEIGTKMAGCLIKAACHFLFTGDEDLIPCLIPVYRSV